MSDAITTLAQRVLQLHKSATDGGNPNLLSPSAPVLYLGDRAKYMESPLRVATVGLNPPAAEFPEADPFQRFPGIDETRSNPAKYLELLDNYFRTAPNAKWFDSSFEPLLNGLDASYEGKQTSTALHTNLCTPLATEPAWSKVAERAQFGMQVEGFKLWHELINQLDPDLILVSVSRQYLKSITFDRLGVSDDVAEIPRASKPYIFEGWRLKLGSGKKSHLVFGTASQTPFGTVKKGDKDRVGKEIAAWMAES